MMEVKRKVLFRQVLMELNFLSNIISDIPRQMRSSSTKRPGSPGSGNGPSNKKQRDESHPHMEDTLPRVQPAEEPIEPGDPFVVYFILNRWSSVNSSNYLTHPFFILPM